MSQPLATIFPPQSNHPQVVCYQFRLRSAKASTFAPTTTRNSVILPRAFFDSKLNIDSIQTKPQWMAQDPLSLSRGRKSGRYSHLKILSLTSGMAHTKQTSGVPKGGRTPQLELAKKAAHKRPSQFLYTNKAFNPRIYPKTMDSSWWIRSVVEQTIRAYSHCW